MRIRPRLPILISAAIVVALTAAGCADRGGQIAASTRSGQATNLSTTLAGAGLAKARAIMDKPAYRAARWLYQVSDLKTGKILLSNRAGEMVFTGSTTKLFTVGAVYDTIGPDARITTPVFRTGRIEHGVLHGNLDLVASGDLTMGGRDAAQGRADDSFTATTVDHVYGDVAPNAALPPGNPLAGLNSLAHQIAARGVHRIGGNVIIDDRLWQTFQGGEGPTQAMFVNDNLLDLTVTPTTTGHIATVTAKPRTAAFRVRSEVKTESGKGVAMQVTADPAHPSQLVVSGSIGVDAGARLTIYRIPDPASWARTLFIEALRRAGVTVTADPLATNPSAGLPAKGSYRARQQVAKYVSPPMSALGSFVLKTSYNTGANALLCLLAVHEGSTDCLDGLAPMRAMAKRAGLDTRDLIFVDGQGADPASTPPMQMIRYLRWTHTQPWAKVFTASQPVLGVSGTLAGVGIHSPAKGKIAAKTGTSAFVEPGTGRALFNVQRLAGFMTTKDGRKLVFDVAMSGGTYPDILTGLTQSNDDVGGVAAAFQQALSR